MTQEQFPFTDEQFSAALRDTIRTILINPALVPVSHPRAVLFGGQSGAGKSTLHVVEKKAFDDNVVVINGDEYRSSHPHFRQIQETYGIDAPAHTAHWSGKMVEALIEAFAGQKYNLVIEGTLRTSEVPLATARLLRQHGYSVSLAIIAVKPEISLLSCQIRYEMMRIAGTTPRAIDPAHHDRIVHDIVDNLAVLEKSGEFDAIELYDRSGMCLFASEGTEPSGETPASDALRNVLFGDWTQEELQHLDDLNRKLAQLKEIP